VDFTTSAPAHCSALRGLTGPTLSADNSSNHPNTNWSYAELEISFAVENSWSLAISGPFFSSMDTNTTPRTRGMGCLGVRWWYPCVFPCSHWNID
jgi:hypothetical protein